MPQPPSLGGRLGARMVDGLLVGIVGGIAATILDLDREWLAVPLALVYETVLVAVRGATFGKQWFGIAVVPEEGGGGMPNVVASAVRAVVLFAPIYVAGDDNLAEWAATLVVLANGFTVARRRDDRRGLHDLAAGTRPVAVA
jgi:uncharacterized RDD family membrane protein YckC